MLFKTLETQEYILPSIKEEEDGSRTPPTATPQVSLPPIIETSNIVSLNPLNTTPTLHVNGSAPLNKRETRKSESEKEEKEREKRPRSR